MLNGLDLFSGYGGITLALQQWVRPLAYCEIERYAQGILLSRMQSGELPKAPIWDDIKTLDGKQFQGIVDIVYGGFPCQDISIAGNRKGLAGERSELFFEIVRLCGEIRPRFIFLENVRNILSNGIDTVAGEMVKLGYDCRWGILSAKEVGANHERKRWWMLAYSRRKQQGREKKLERPHNQFDRRSDAPGRANNKGHGKEKLPHAKSERLQRQRKRAVGDQKKFPFACSQSWWEVEPQLGRVVDGCEARVDRIKALGNGVVPLQAKEAFKELIGFK